MAVEVKICGLSTVETLEAALAAGAEFVGLNFYPPSPRCVSLERAAELATLARRRAKIVAVFVDADDDLLSAISRAVTPDYYQAHGKETPERISAIARMTGKPVIKAITVGESADVARVRDYAGKASMILFDAKAPKSLLSALPGGNGIAFDWSLLNGFEQPGKFLLSGGLHPGNVAEAVSTTGAPIVDVSSGVESAPGVKDAGLIRKFIEAAKSAR